MLKRRGSAASKHQARLAWLTAHPAQYVGVPGINEDVTDAGRARLDALVEEMTARDLMGQSPRSWRDTVRRLVSELRGEHIGGGF